jgi:hypothetical protein
MSEPSSRKQYKRFHVLLRGDQGTFIQDDANVRYPELHGKTQQRRNFNPALRDMIDFIIAHYSLFLIWIVSRNNSPPQTPGGAE